MKTTSEQFREITGAIHEKLKKTRRSAGEGRTLMKEVLRLAKGGLRDIASGDSAAVDRRKIEISRAIQKMKEVERGWLREQLIERAGSVLVRFTFVQAYFPCLFGERKVPDLGTFSSERLKVSDQAWLWGVVGGPKELYDVLRLARMDESLAFEDHVTSLRRFLEIAGEVAGVVVADIAESYSDDVLNISGDRRNSLQGELRKLRRFISSREEDLVRLLASTAPER